jgi:hypothetical protein
MGTHVHYIQVLYTSLKVYNKNCMHTTYVFLLPPPTGSHPQIVPYFTFMSLAGGHAVLGLELNGIILFFLMAEYYSTEYICTF